MLKINKGSIETLSMMPIRRFFLAGDVMVKIKQKVDNDIFLVSIRKGYITVGDVINTERADRDTSLWFNFHK